MNDATMEFWEDSTDKLDASVPYIDIEEIFISKVFIRFGY